MNGTMRTLGQMAAAAAVAVTLLLGAMQVPGTEAKPIKDVRTVEAKVTSFSQDCEALGGTATDRPSATDSDKTISKCNGGAMGGNACIYTATTTDCMPMRVKPPTPSGVPELIDGTTIAAKSGAGQLIADRDHGQNQVQHSHRGKRHGKQGGKGR